MIYGGAGNDTLGSGLFDSDTLYGGDGDDVFVMDTGESVSNHGGIIDGGSGYDEFRFLSDASNLWNIEFSGVERLTFADRNSHTLVLLQCLHFRDIYVTR